jgi:hypothetical protein
MTYTHEKPFYSRFEASSSSFLRVESKAHSAAAAHQPERSAPSREQSSVRPVQPKVFDVVVKVNNTPLTALLAEVGS